MDGTVEAMRADTPVPVILPPPAVLADRLLCLWRLDCDRAASLPIFPDGCLDVILHWDGEGRRVGLLTGMDLKARAEHLHPGMVFLGARLAPGVDARGLLEPGLGLGECHHDLRTSGGPASQRWLEKALVEPDSNVLLEHLDTCLKAPDDGVRAALQQAAEGGPGGLSTRTLHRHVIRATGTNPRTWRALARVRRAGLALLESDEALAEIAEAQGYADQAHLTRDLVRRLGLTPGALRRHREWAPLLRAPSGF